MTKPNIVWICLDQCRADDPMERCNLMTKDPPPHVVDEMESRITARRKATGG